MEPERNTVSRLLDVQAELLRLEPIFHRPECGTDRGALERMTDEAFWEVGASGRRYSRGFVIDTVMKRGAEPQAERWWLEDAYCQPIAPENYLLTYTLHQGSRVTRRATLWRRGPGGWRMVYHQGTVVEAGPVDANLKT